MSIPEEFARRIAEFPVRLRSLIEAELAAGNEIVELAICFPAPPAGAYVKLARPISTRARKSGKGLDFYERDTSSHSGEFTDAKRFFFVLEPPLPPPPEPDMSTIRATVQARTSAPWTAERRPARRESGQRKSHADALPTVASPVTPPPREPQSAVDRFRESMKIDHEKWHDGIGYDLDILKTATPEELVEIENLLVSRGATDWRDVEALALLNSPRAVELLRNALASGDHRLAAAVMTYAPALVSDEERASRLVAALEGSAIYGGLTQTLSLVEAFHPPRVVDALFRGVLQRDGETAVHFAAMLMFLHGKAKSAFDWDQRPFFLKFNTEDRAQREALFRELCRLVRIDADKALGRDGNS